MFLKAYHAGDWVYIFDLSHIDVSDFLVVDKPQLLNMFEGLVRLQKYDENVDFPWDYRTFMCTHNDGTLTKMHTDSGAVYICNNEGKTVDSFCCRR